MKLKWFLLVFNTIKLDLLEFFRARVILISALLTPVSMIFAYGLGMKSMSNGNLSYFETVVPGILAISVMFSATNSIGYGTIIDRQKRTIEDMVLSRRIFSSYMVARYVAMLLKAFFQFMLVLLLAVLFFGFKVQSFGMLLFGFFNCCIFFTGFGIILALYNNEVSFSSVSNCLLMPLFYFGGVFFPIENFGKLADFLKYVPLSIHVLLLKYASSKTCNYSITQLSVITTLYSVIAVVAATMLFKHKVKNH